MNSLGVPCVSVIQSREVSVTRRFSMSMGERSGLGIMFAII